MGFSFGDVVLVPFPFTDQNTTKKRPAVVVSSAALHRGRPDLRLIAVTSQFRPIATVGEASIEGWAD
jgi:mRNA interferase MazF